MRKLILSASVVCMALNMTAYEQLYTNIAGIKSLVEQNRDAFSDDFGMLLKAEDDYVSAFALQGALPELTECILIELTRANQFEGSCNALLNALANLASIKRASGTVFKSKRSNDQAQVIIQSIDELFCLLPDEISGMITRAPLFDFSNKGVREIVLEKLAPNMEEVVDQSCTVQSISDMLVVQLSALDQLNVTICSKLENLEEVLVQDGSAIDVDEVTVCSFDSQIDVINDDLLTIESKLDFVNTLDSTIDIIDDAVSNIDIIFDDIDESTVTIESIVCVLDSKIDVILADNNTASIDSKIDVIDDDVCTADSKVCFIESDLEILNSRLDVIKADVIEIGVGVSIIDSLINP